MIKIKIYFLKIKRQWWLFVQKYVFQPTFFFLLYIFKNRLATCPEKQPYDPDKDMTGQENGWMDGWRWMETVTYNKLYD